MTEDKNIGILRDKLPGFSTEATQYLADILTKEGMGVSFLNIREILNLGRKPFREIDLLILVSCALPVETKERIVSFLKKGGKIFVLGKRLFEDIAWRYQGKWIDRQTRARILKKVPIQKTLLNPKNFAPSDFTWEFNTPLGEEATAGSGEISLDKSNGKSDERSIKIEGELDKECLSITFGKDISNPFPSQNKLTCFWAKGSAQTSELAIIWTEKDGSRWVVPIPLKPEWQYYVLTPEQFAYVGGGKDTQRGGPKDTFKPKNAIRLSFALDMIYCRNLTLGNHKLWLGKLGTSFHPLQGPDPREDYPILEGLTPPYKIYPLKGISCIKTSPGQKIVDEYSELSLVKGFSPVVCHQGLGFSKSRPSRWLSILEGYDSGGEKRGSLLSILVHNATPYKGAIWAYLGTDQLSFLQSQAVTRILIQTVQRLLKGVFLIEGGSEFFAYKDGEPVKLGAKIANFGSKPEKLKLSLKVKGEKDKPLFQKVSILSLAEGETKEVEWLWQPEKLKEKVYKVETVLFQNDKPIDAISHGIQRIPVWEKEISENFVKVKEGDFWIGDKKWYPIGVNYWPSNSAVVEREKRAFLDKTYDPSIVEKDLQKIEYLGMTMLSIELPPPRAGSKYKIDSQTKRNLEDFLLRCYKHNLKVNLFIPGLDPIKDEGVPGLKILQNLRLQNNPVLFAYDIAWEPVYSKYEGEPPHRTYRRFDEAWQEWILERYESISAAEKDWGYRVRRLKGKIVSPSTRQIRHDGPWRRMVCAYRRFFNDYISKKYREVITAIREIDSNHLVSFRGSSPWISSEGVGFCPIHSPGVAGQIDFICPEAYGVVGKGLGCRGKLSKWEEIFKGGLTTIFHKFQSRGKPVFWAEYGVTIFRSLKTWDKTVLEPSLTKLKFQKREASAFYRMFAESSAHGAAYWWFPGGYRPEEKSDYGMCNPDGTLRPVANAISRTIPLFGKIKETSNYWITIDLDEHFYDAFEFYGEKYVKAIKRGRIPGIKTDATGKTSLNVPLLAVGNTPYNGSNPLKYLNAEFIELSIHIKNRWKPIKSTEKIRIEKDKSIKIRAGVFNSGEATWISPFKGRNKPGTIYLRVNFNDHVIRAPLPTDVPYLKEIIFPEFEIPLPKSQEFHLTLEMEARDRACFGERRKIILRRE